ncbi:unnamed protein product [Enterobius vermicularis]|uniref:Uncharacterized protein n=1 Tax=Enterobius vermicularis TaxID=51028 RepID=A0A0N4VMQ6_ENTVE|nr:unnamed protein product [Enterobius vermicularis]
MNHRNCDDLQPVKTSRSGRTNDERTGSRANDERAIGGTTEEQSKELPPVRRAVSERANQRARTRLRQTSERINDANSRRTDSDNGGQLDFVVS